MADSAARSSDADHEVRTGFARFYDSRRYFRVLAR